MTNRKKAEVLIRVDSSAEIGSGHVMRCLALAQQLRANGFSAIFLSSELDAGLSARLIAESFRVEVQNNVAIGSSDDAAKTLAIALECEVKWIVIDGYQFGSSFQKTLRSEDLALLMFDDFGHSEEYSSEIVLNQNIYANSSFYPWHSAHTKFLLGVKYSLLRSEFLNLEQTQKSIRPILGNILVTMGGSDVPNFTKKILAVIETSSLPNLRVTLIAGSLNRHLNELGAAAAASRHSVSVLKNTNEMPRYIREADIGISGGGSTYLELCFLALPFATVVLAENQERTAMELEASSLSVNLGWHDRISESEILKVLEAQLFPFAARSRLSANAKSIIDGKGSQRVVTAMNEIKKLSSRRD